MFGRNHIHLNYRYGFNGMEKDDENFEGSYDFGARIYDGRIGRFVSKDPLLASSPYYSSYMFAGNKPIIAIDREGLEEYFTQDGKLIYSNGTDGITYIVNDDYLKLEVFVETIQYPLPTTTIETQYMTVEVTAPVDYSKFSIGELKEGSAEMNNLMKYSNSNETGEAVLDLFKKDPSMLGSNDGKVCVESSFEKAAIGFETATGKKFPKKGSEFYQIWAVWGVDDMLGVKEGLKATGAPAAIDWSGMGTALTEKEIKLGELIPGNIIVYQDVSIGGEGHSMIFLGYDYSDEGEIIGVNVWSQWCNEQYQLDTWSFEEHVYFGANIDTPTEE